MGFKRGFGGGVWTPGWMGKWDGKQRKAFSVQGLGRKLRFLKMLDFVYFCAHFGENSGENVRKGVLFVRFWRTFVFRRKTRVEKSSGKIEKSFNADF